MTSNIGSTAIARGRESPVGFLTADDKSTSYARMKAIVMDELEAYFSPELLNRIDEIVVFRRLEKAQVFVTFMFLLATMLLVPCVFFL